MLFYSWKKVMRHSAGKVQILRLILESVLEVPTYSFTQRYRNTDFKGNSYLLNPHGLLHSFYTNNQVDCANYWYLASLRNFSEYQITGDKTLPLKYTNIPVEKLNKNSLLKVENNKIHFLKEN